MKPFLFALFATAALVGTAAPASAAALRSDFVVEGDIVRLGDLFEDAGPKADAPVMYSPAPGRRVTLNAAWLSQVARAFQVAWRPFSQSDHIIVERAGKSVTAAEYLPPLRRALQAQGMPEHADIELNNRNLKISLALNIPSTIEVRNATYDHNTGLFSALLLVGGDSQDAQRITAQGRAFATTAVPVLRRQFSAGEIIRKDDIDIVYRRDETVGRDVIADAKQLVGRTPQYRVRAGDLVRLTDVRAPLLVSRNSQVIIRLEWGAMTITAQGKAVDEGARGDVIRVQNLQSNKTIEATVAGPDLVMVSMGPRLAASN